MREMLQFYIDGKWVDPVTPNPLDVINPATEEVCGRISLGSADDVDLAVAAAKRAFATYSQTTREERIALLEAILAEFSKRHDEVAEAIMEEMGAPWGLAKNAQAASGPHRNHPSTGSSSTPAKAGPSSFQTARSPAARSSRTSGTSSCSTRSPTSRISTSFRSPRC